ncbi:MAG: BatD family protein [Alphaproteobacteria bacterium]|nr:BatD family protein [Alphaproteobacteria bacterium]
MKIFNFLFYVCLFFYSFVAIGDELHLYLDKNVLSQGDVLALTVEYSGDENGKPDFGDIEKDFQIVSNSSSSQYSIINGNITQSKKWTIGLKPLKTGKITIKPIRFAGLISNYAEVEVKKLTDTAYIPDSENNFNSPFFQIKQKLEANEAYIHQQLLTKVIIYDSLGLKDGRLNIINENNGDWVIKQLYENPYVEQKIINGKKMNVITFLFALFPQKSGKLIAPSFLFDGYYLKDANFGFADFNDDIMMFGVDFKNAFGQKVPVRMETKKKEITIKPSVDGVMLKDWLPLKNLEITSNISAKNGFKVGEAFNRTIELKAVGVDKHLMPVLSFEDIKGMKSYPEKPEYKEEVVNGNLVSYASYNIVYIPSQSGEFVIPKIDINWFNVVTGKLEKSSTEDEKINVFANNSIQHENKIEEKTNVVEQENKVEEKTESKFEKNLNQEKQSFMFWFSIIGGILFALFVGFIMGVKKSDKKNVTYYKKALLNAIERHDYRTAKNMIIEWAKLKFGDENIKNFKDINEYIKNPYFEKQLDILNKLLYSGSDELLDSIEFVKEFKKIDKIKFKKNNSLEVLPNLYK